MLTAIADALRLLRLVVPRLVRPSGWRGGECKDWADKMEAMASYAKQAGDDSLRKTADRIQARAIRRCGELLDAIKPAKGGERLGAGRPSKQLTGHAHNCPAINQRDGTGPLISRSSAARDAGLSERQQKTALRIANIPEAEFEELIEAPEPPTVTALAELAEATPRVHAT